MKTPHYLRVIQALVLAAAATPACSADAPQSSSTGVELPPGDVPQATTVAPAPPHDIAVAVDVATDASADGHPPHTSGPIVPPECQT